MTGLVVVFFICLCVYQIQSKCSFTVPFTDALPIKPLDDEPFYMDNVPPCPMY